MMPGATTATVTLTATLPGTFISEEISHDIEIGNDRQEVQSEGDTKVDRRTVCVANAASATTTSTRYSSTQEQPHSTHTPAPSKLPSRAHLQSRPSAASLIATGQRDNKSHLQNHHISDHNQNEKCCADQNHDPDQLVPDPEPDHDRYHTKNLDHHQRLKSSPTHTASLPLPSLNVEPRSPPSKARRAAPASRSSNGIGTRTGPPPALSTQRSYTAESLRASPITFDSTAHAQTPLSLGGISDADRVVDVVNESGNIPLAPERHNSIAERQHSALRSTASRTGSRGISDDMSRDSNDDYGGHLHDLDRDQTLRTLESGSVPSDYVPRSYDEEDMTMTEETTDGLGGPAHQPSGEDLFLNIARSSANTQALEEASTRSERRRSRIGLPSLRQGPASNSGSSSFHTPPTGARTGSDHGENHGRSRGNQVGEEWFDAPSQASPPPPSQRSSSRLRYSATSAHMLDSASRSHHFGTSRASFGAHGHQYRGEVSPEGNANYHGRRPSLPAASVISSARSQSYRPSQFSYPAPSKFSSHSPSAYRALPETPLAHGTESTASTTAPSTVWDELDDIRSRIRKLELTGKLPSSSGAAISNGSAERPRTATTTVTTVSSSPKRIREESLSPDESTVGGSIAANVHPLLHSALAKSKACLSADVYRALEAAAADALSLAAFMSKDAGPQGYTAGDGNALPERQIRRKADSMCRGLTELCIALSDAKLESPSQPTMARSQPALPPAHASTATPEGRGDTLASRRASADADALSVTRSGSRALTRADARRSSLLANSPTFTPSPHRARSTAEPGPSATSNRFQARATSTSIRSRRLSSSSEASPSIRPVSRAATEIVPPYNHAHSRREYTSQHPLPPQAQSQAQSRAQVQAHAHAHAQAEAEAEAEVQAQAQAEAQAQTQTQVQTRPSSVFQPLRSRTHHLSSSISGIPSPLNQTQAPSQTHHHSSIRRFFDRSSPAAQARDVAPVNVGQESKIAGRFGSRRAGSVGGDLTSPTRGQDREGFVGRFQR